MNILQNSSVLIINEFPSWFVPLFILFFLFSVEIYTSGSLTSTCISTCREEEWFRFLPLDLLFSQVWVVACWRGLAHMYPEEGLGLILFNL